MEGINQKKPNSKTAVSGIKLSEEDRSYIKELSKRVNKDLIEIQKIILKTLNYKIPADSDEIDITYQKKGEKEYWVIRDKAGNCVAIHEDPPGICRPCG